MMVIMANRYSIADIVSEINNVAYNKFKANAFMHWYYKFGIAKGDFENTFLIMDNIVENYNSLKWFLYNSITFKKKQYSTNNRKFN